MRDDADAAPGNLPVRRLARRILIVGGVAGGASCAARLRRLDESVEIVIFDRGPYVAFANCGLPYYVGDVIADERTLLVASPEMFRERFNIEVHTTPTSLASIARRVRSLFAISAPATAALSGTTRWFCHRARRRFGHSCREWTCLASSRCATFRTRAAFVPGLPAAAPAPRSSSSADSSDWRWSRI